MKPFVLPPGPWAWHYTPVMAHLLAADRTTILAAYQEARFATIGVNAGEWEGPPFKIVPLTPDNPYAVAIAAVPELAAACRVLLKWFDTTPIHTMEWQHYVGLQFAVEAARMALTNARLLPGQAAEEGGGR